MEKLIEQYRIHLCNERNVSPHTLRNYLSDLHQFHQFISERKWAMGSTGCVDVQKIDIQIVRAFLASLTPGTKKEFARQEDCRFERVFSVSDYGAATRWRSNGFDSLTEK
jgi:site-specific recombinase XerD